ncbi:MAG: ABC transporter substrate-binding protein [Magnetococcus sp. WYHC-3]
MRPFTLFPSLWMQPLLLALLLLLPGHAGAGQPTEQLRPVVTQALSILKDPRYSGPNHSKTRLEQLRQALNPRFDFRFMATKILGREWWQRMSTAQQDRFVDLFRRLLEQKYAQNIGDVGEPRVDFVGERVLRADQVVVVDTVATIKDVKVPMGYYMRMTREGGWKVYDVEVAGDSTVLFYRNNIGAILGNSSVEDMLRKLEQKVNESSTPAPAPPPAG